MPMVLTVTPATQSIGAPSIFTVMGGPPGAPIFWSSVLNNVSTGENHQGYGQTLDAAGNWSGSGGNWPAVLNGRSTVGEWEKTVYAQPLDGSAEVTAKAEFRVIAASGGGAQQSGGGLLDGSFNIAGYQV